jgi:hypothetical protein
MMTTITNNRISSLFMWLIAVGVAHMSEQLLTNIEEFYMIRGLIDDWHGLFPAAKNGQASVILITLVFTLVSFMFWALAKGGKAALVIMGFFGLFAVSEAHHLFEALGAGSYDPGVITSVFYVWFGSLMLMEVWREWRWGPVLKTAAA